METRARRGTMLGDADTNEIITYKEERITADHLCTVYGSTIGANHGCGLVCDPLCYHVRYHSLQLGRNHGVSMEFYSRKNHRKRSGGHMTFVTRLAVGKAGTCPPDCKTTIIRNPGHRSRAYGKGTPYTFGKNSLSTDVKACGSNRASSAGMQAPCSTHLSCKHLRPRRFRTDVIEWQEVRDKRCMQGLLPNANKSEYISFASMFGCAYGSSSQVTCCEGGAAYYFCA